MSSAPRLRWAARAAAGVFALTLAPVALANDAPLRVAVQPSAGLADAPDIAAASCPDAAVLEAQLRPLWASGATLEVSTLDAAAAGLTPVVVRDDGDHYTVRVHGAERTLDDPSRDCVERARVAAVFITLNLAQRGTGEAAPPAPEREGDDQALPEPEAVPAPPSASVGVDLRLLAGVMHAPDAGASSADLGAGVGLSLGHVRVGIDVLATWPTRIPLASAPTSSSSAVVLTRGLLELSVAWLPELGPLRLGPWLALGADLMHTRGTGTGVAQARTEVRINPGASTGAELQLPLGSRLTLDLRLSARLYPRTYALRLEPEGRLGTTPHVWLGADLGMVFDLP